MSSIWTKLAVGAFLLVALTGVSNAEEVDTSGWTDEQFLSAIYNVQDELQTEYETYREILVNYKPTSKKAKNQAAKLKPLLVQFYRLCEDWEAACLVYGQQLIDEGMFAQSPKVKAVRNLGIAIQKMRGKYSSKNLPTSSKEFVAIFARKISLDLPVRELEIVATSESSEPTIPKRDPEKPAPSQTKQTFTKTVTVSDVASLEKAYRNAQSGERILLKPGTYTLQNTLEITKDITIASTTGNPKDVVITGQGTTLEMTGGKPMLQGLSLSGIDGIIVRNTGTFLTMENCIIKDARHAGIDVGDQSDAMIRNCEIFGSRNVGLGCFNGANTTIIGSKMHHNNEHGCHIGFKSKGTMIIQNCEIYENGGNGINLENNSEVTVENSSLHNNGGDGMRAVSGIFNVQKCEISSNHASGISFENGSNVTVVNCRLHHNSYNGVWVKSATLKILESQIFQNPGHGIHGVGTASITAERNQFSGNGSEGVELVDQAQGVFTQNVLQNNCNWKIESPNVRRINNRPNQ